MHKEKQENRYLWNRIYIDGNQNKYPWDSVVSFIYNYRPKGISHKTKDTINFMKIKMREYEELKNELKKQKK